MSELNIRIETTNHTVANSFLSRLKDQDDLKVLLYKPTIHRSEELPCIVELIVTITNTIGLNILSNWLYDKLSKGNNDSSSEKGTTTIKINRREFVFDDKDRLIKALEEEYEFKS